MNMTNTMPAVKKIAILLLAVMTTAIIFSSCSEDKKTDQGSETADAASVTAEAETTDTKFYDNLPKLDFEGYNYRVLCATSNYYLVTFDPEEPMDIVEDALFKRNAQIESRLNINFTADYDSWSNNTNAFKLMVNSNDDAYDTVQIINRDAFSMATQGLVVPVSQLPYVDITQPYYSHDINEQMSIAGKLFTAYSDECFHLFGSTNALVFNKELAAENNIGNLYDAVRGNTWTYAKLFEIARLLTQDIDGDGIFSIADQYGIVYREDFLFPNFWVSSGELTIMKDADDIPFFNALTSTRFAEVVSYAIENLNAQPFGIIAPTVDAIARFSSRGAFMYMLDISVTTRLRDMEDDYGLVPFPKYDESQEEFYCRVIDGWLHIVPMSNSDLERTSAVLEALACESANIVFPAYYTYQLQNKALRDEESIEMLEILRQHKTLDLGDVTWAENVRSIYTPLFSSGRTDIASASAKAEKSVNKKIQTSVDKILELG